MTAPTVPSAGTLELHEELLRHTQSGISFGDGPVAAALLVSVLLGLWAAHADVCDMKSRSAEEPALDAVPQVPPASAAVPHTILRVLCCAAAVVVAAGLSAMALTTGHQR